MSPVEPARRKAALEELPREKLADLIDQSDVLLQRIEALADYAPEKTTPTPSGNHGERLRA